MNLAVPFVTEAYAFFRDAELSPTWGKLGRKETWWHLQDAAAKRQGGYPRDARLQRELNASAPVVSDELLPVLRDDPFRREWLELVPVRRCWGVHGLFWALLIDRLESGRAFNLCERCAGPLPKPRRLCGPKDFRGCFVAQAKERQRRKRSRDESGH
jgi:hypothetical protein